MGAAPHAHDSNITHRNQTVAERKGELNPNCIYDTLNQPPCNCLFGGGEASPGRVPGGNASLMKHALCELHEGICQSRSEISSRQRLSLTSS